MKANGNIYLISIIIIFALLLGMFYCLSAAEDTIIHMSCKKDNPYILSVMDNKDDLLFTINSRAGGYPYEVIIYKDQMYLERETDSELIYAIKKNTTNASWYSEESCRKEGTSGIMANGDHFDDSALTCASWDYPFGTKLRVSHGDKSVIVEVTDRGPNKKLYANGRKLDLSRAAFACLASLDKGVIQVSIDEID